MLMDAKAEAFGPLRTVATREVGARGAAFLAGLVEGAHACGALFLADEVQSGFGRSGPQLWRFAAAGITPDVVTLGKPMGAGYPIGAVLTRREVADSLSRDYEYFSTFAATPAAAAAGCAVLDVLTQERLPEQGMRIGAHLRGRLRQLADGTGRLGEVRGVGLLAGIDLTGPDGPTDRAFAIAVRDGLAARGVLAGLTGPTGTVLKVRPPLVWREEHADLFVDTLAATLSGIDGS